MGHFPPWLLPLFPPQPPTPHVCVCVATRLRVACRNKMSMCRDWSANYLCLLPVVGSSGHPKRHHLKGVKDRGHTSLCAWCIHTLGTQYAPRVRNVVLIAITLPELSYSVGLQGAAPVGTQGLDARPCLLQKGAQPSQQCTHCFWRPDEPLSCPVLCLPAGV